MNFPLSYVSEDALKIVGQSWAMQYQANESDACRDLRLKASELTTHGEAINRHKWFLSERLGRDVGFHVAAADYFENIHPADTSSAKTSSNGVRSSVKAFFQKVLDLGLSFDGPNSLLNFERAMNGTRSLAR